MKCEYCDSYIAQVPDNGICPNCGGPMGIEEKSWKRKFPNPPVGLYEDTGDYIEITQTQINIHIKGVLSKDVNRSIPFGEVCAVKFVLGSGLKTGFLCVRERKDMSMPMPNSFAQAVNDETTICFISTHNEKFYPVYAFLKQCADIVNGE